MTLLIEEMLCSVKLYVIIEYDCSFTNHDNSRSRWYAVPFSAFGSSLEDRIMVMIPWRQKELPVPGSQYPFNLEPKFGVSISGFADVETT